jgi:origin recognition complex subunit 1
LDAKGKGKTVEPQIQTRTSAKESLKRLTRHFEDERKTRSDDLPLVVLMDELDQLMTPKQDVVYNFFNWPQLEQSRLIVIAVANTHDMPERTMSNKVRSRLGASLLVIYQVATVSDGRSRHDEV